MNKSYLIMGILNVTPDSFSDGGLYLDVNSALAHGRRLIDEGADVIDVGGESTRPGASPISIQTEIDRVIPVIRALSKLNIPLSIDTRHFEVADAAVKAGASIINDVSGGIDIRMAELVAEKNLTICLMHMKGDPTTMQFSPHYEGGVMSEVKDFLSDRVRAFLEFGISPDKIWIDPGIGFGKDLNHNLSLLHQLEELKGIAGRILIGTSRKSFLAKIIGDKDALMTERVEPTIATNLWAYQKGASVFRVHDVSPLKRALLTWDRIQTHEENSSCTRE